MGEFINTTLKPKLNAVRALLILALLWGCARRFLTQDEKTAFLLQKEILLTLILAIRPVLLNEVVHLRRAQISFKLIVQSS